MNKPLLKLRFVGVSLLLLGLTTLTSAQNALNINDLNGVKTILPIKDIRNITFPASNISINKKNGTNFTLAVSSLRVMNFSTEIITSFNGSNFTVNSFTIFPNPVNDILTINLSNESAKIQIVDLNGSIVINQSLNVLSNSLNVSNLPKGVYLCKIESGGIIETLKFVK